ncbi:MAG: FadR/GntR family transcriptional regulator [Candidatus Bipolaricaulaceae bacterium]
MPRRKQAGPRFSPLLPVPLSTKSDRVLEAIAEKIERGELKPGDRLPSERELATQLGVSRPAVREAIAALQFAGLVESRVGDGTYVTFRLTQPVELLLSRAREILQTSQSPLEVLTLRRVLEVGAARLAVRRATPEDDERLRTIWEKKKSLALAGRYEEYLSIAEEFHLALAQATHSSAVIQMVAEALRAVHQPLWRAMRVSFYRKDPQRIHEMLAVHEAILQAFLARDVDALTRAVELHFDLQIQQLYARSKEEPDEGQD